MRKTIDGRRRDTHPRWRDDGQDDGDGRRDQYWRHYHREDETAAQAWARWLASRAVTAGTMNAVCDDQPVSRLWSGDVYERFRAASRVVSLLWCAIYQAPSTAISGQRRQVYMRRDNILFFYYFDRTDRKRALYLCDGHVSIIPMYTLYVV